jgi:hypothetical protein
MIKIEKPIVWESLNKLYNVQIKYNFLIRLYDILSKHETRKIGLIIAVDKIILIIFLSFESGEKQLLWL